MASKLLSSLPSSLPPPHTHTHTHTHSQNGESPRVLGEEEQLVRQQERQKMFREYRSQRQAVLQLRNDDRELRNRTKLQQLEMAEQWQVSL